MSSENQNMCHDFSQEIWLYLSEELPEERFKLWQAHLQACEKCRIKMQEMQQILRVYNEVPLDAPDENWLKVAIDRATGVKPSRRLTLSPIKSQKVVMTALALAASILLIFILSKPKEPSEYFGWEGQSLDTFISEIDSSMTDWDSTEGWTLVSENGYNNDSEDLDNQIDEIQDRLELLREDLQNAM